MNKTIRNLIPGIIHLMIALTLATAVILTAPPSSRADHGVLYTAPSAVGSGDCFSWANACALQTALINAVSSNEIWVQAGVHYPGSNRTDTFSLQSGVALYGGFAGSETSRDQRDWQTNVTVLSGDIDQNDINNDGNFIAETWNDIKGENAYHVVTGSETDSTAILDGFVITAGQANGDYPNFYGGGMYNFSNSPALMNINFSGNFANSGGGMYNSSSSPTLIDVTFNGNQSVTGGGMYNSSSSPTLIDVTFSANIGNEGGGMYNNSSSPALTHVTFSGNSADNTAGGMYNINSSSPMLTNVTFSSNSAIRFGGGMYNNSSSPSLTNVTFNGNTAEYGGGMYNYSNSPSMTNVILWGNIAPNSAGVLNESSMPQISYSDIQDCGGSGGWNSACGTNGGGNIETDPLFVDSANGDLRLQLTSPAIDAGNNAALTPDILTDLDGNPRFVDIPTVPDTGNGTAPIVDMGAYEAQYVDVTLSKTVLPQTAAPGEAISFTLTLANTGSIPATGIEVTDAMPTWLTGVSFTSTLIVTDKGHVPPFVWLVQDLAPGQAGLITVSGVLTVPLSAGTYTNSASISAVDDLLAENNTGAINFTVPNVAPIFTSAPIITATEAAPYIYTLTAQDDNGDTRTINASTMPAWLTLTDHGNGTATLAGTPMTADVGHHAVELRVYDSDGLSDMQTFTITVWGRIYLPLVMRDTP